MMQEKQNSRRRKITEFIIPARRGKSFKVRKGHIIRVTDVEGCQVGDFIAFNAHMISEHFRTSHTRVLNNKIYLSTGNKLYSNLCNPMFTIVQDTVGKHDVIRAICSEPSYRVRFNYPDHDNCVDNLTQSLKEIGVEASFIPDPFNIFQNVDLDSCGNFLVKEPKSKAGDYIELKAEMDCIVAISACPQDLIPINAGNPTPLKISILEE